MKKTPTTLIIMDGFGLRAETAGNAIANAKKPHLDRLFAENPGCKLSASGLDVGLPEGQMGNSEVGHTNIGAGRVVWPTSLLPICPSGSPTSSPDAESSVWAYSWKN